jgi:L-threonylcarbamoyladenylate synthase
LLSQHYSPRTPLILVDDLHSLYSIGADRRLGLLSFLPVERVPSFEAIEVLSPGGDLLEAASNFFAALHRLDDRQLDLIVALSFPERGLGRALNDRLRRAAHA